MDGTFKVMRDPFVQFFSLHVFVNKGESSKQVPVCFVLMSNATAETYRNVLLAIIEYLGGVESVRWTDLMLDFERAMWSGLNGNQMRDKALLVKLVSNKFILRQQRTKYKRHQGRIFIHLC